MRLLPGAALSAVLLSILVGCGAPMSTRPPATPTPGPQAPMVSPSAQVAAAAAVVERALAEAGFRLEQSPMEYRPAEPEGIHRVPRAVHRVGLNDPNAGWVLIYDLRQSEAAAQAGRDFATYLGSGFGQTNYPFDAQFTLNQIGGALVFSWWSRERSPDPDAAEAAFEAIKAVGQPIEVRR